MRTSIGSGAARAVLIALLAAILLVVLILAGAVAVFAAPAAGPKNCMADFTISAAGCSAPPTEARIQGDPRPAGGEDSP
ncbi:MAG: hypothetical protein JKP97_09290 [Rhodobacteraceae bacterium]|nr:hypothetical protein [Paracoccaceae bacterium]